MPVYDCGDPGCCECQAAFGPNRSRAIENFRRRDAYYNQMERSAHQTRAALSKAEGSAALSPETK